MNKYQDEFSLYHDVPISQGYSGNPAIYTAYAQKLGLPIDYLKVEEAFKLIQVERNGHKYLLRHPSKTNYESSPTSRDEIMSWAALGLLKPEHIPNWNFSRYPLPRFSLTQLVKQLPSLIKNSDDRNYFWKNNLDQIYRFAFSVPLTDRYFLLDKWGNYNKFNPIHQIYRLVAKIDSLLPKENGIRWLKYGKSLKGMQKEFPEDHPFKEFK